MPILSTDEILKLSKAATDAGLVASRDALLAGIDDEVKSRIPRHDRPDAQVFADLAYLNKLTDGAVPLLVWLKTAEQLVGPRAERKIFARFRKRVEQSIPRRAPTSARLPRAPPTPTPPPGPATNGTGGVGAPVPTDPEQAEWLHGMREWRRWPALGLVIGLVVIVILLMLPRGSSRIARFGCDAVQLVCVFYFFVHAILTRPRGLERVKSDWVGDDREQCKECVDEFTRKWRLLWYIWVLFYTLHCIRHLAEYRVEPPNRLPVWGPGWSAGLGSLHLIQSGTLVLLFWTLIRPTIEKSQRQMDRVELLVWGIVFVLVVGNALVLLLMGSGPAFVSALALGSVVAAAHGLLTGRLESRYFLVGVVEIMLLYLYTAIQPLFRVTVWMEHNVKGLEDTAIATDLWLKLLALVLKLGLYTVVYRQIKSGRLAFYMWKVRVRHTEAKNDWVDFERGKLEPPEPAAAGTSTSRGSEQEPPRADERAAG